MKIVKPNAVLLDDKSKTPYELIELIGRTCYKSEDRITTGSAVKFVKNMCMNGHLAMLEHAVIHLLMPEAVYEEFIASLEVDYENINDNSPVRFMKFSHVNDTQCIVTGSFRTFYELMQNKGWAWNNVGWILTKTYPEVFDDGSNCRYMTDNHTAIISDDELISLIRNNSYYLPEIGSTILMQHIYHSIKFTCDRGVSHEFVRHRPASFAQESTRFCNYSKGSFGNEITVVEPIFYKQGTLQYELWKESCERDSETYFKLLELGATPQQARDNLPTSTKTDIVITASENEWKYIIDLRLTGTTGKPHPQMVEVMNMAYPALLIASDMRLAIESDNKQTDN